MFDPNSQDKPSSLLMRARRRGADERRAEPDTRQDHRHAKAWRRAGKPSPLLAGLAAQSSDGAGERDVAEKPSARRWADAYRTPPVRDRKEPAGKIETDDPGAKNRRTVSEPTQRGASTATLFDPIELIGAIWRWRWGVVLCTIIGAMLGLFVATSSPTKYTAYSEILIDPRELNLIERDLEREFLGNEAALAIIDSRLSLVTSRPVLERVIEQTNLDQDPEFNGSSVADGLLDRLSLFTAPSGEPQRVAAQSRSTMENLGSAISIDRQTRTFVVSIGVESENPQKAALLANAVTEAFIAQQSAITAERAGEANTALTERLATLQADAETAERRLAQFRAENELLQTDGQLISEGELAQSNTQLSEARAVTIRARARAEAAQAGTVQAVIDGSLPNELVTPALTTFRAQYASLRQGAAQLESQLGPRHPRLNSAQASLEAARQDIGAELRRIVAGTQSELRQAVQTEQEMAAQVARAKATISNQGEAVVALRDLQSDAEAARAIYDGALLRARETGEIEALGTINASVLAQAEPPRTASSPSSRTIVAGFTLAGFIFGLALAVLAGLAGSLGQGRREPDEDLPQSAEPTTEPDPQTPDPDRKTMYPTYPPYPSQPAGAYAPATPQPAYGHAAQAQPATAYPGYMPYPAPQPAYAQSPFAAPPPHPAMAPMAAQPAMPQPAPWPQPMTYAAPPMAAVMQPAFAPAPMPAQPAPPQRDAEMDALRQSIVEIREVIDELTMRRDNVRRFG